jgi:hypothetical protein
MMMKGQKLHAFASLQSVRDIHTKVWHYHTRGCCCSCYHTPSLTIKVLFVTQWSVLDHHIVKIIRNRNSNSWVHLKYRSRSWSWESINQIKHTHTFFASGLDVPDGKSTLHRHGSFSCTPFLLAAIHGVPMKQTFEEEGAQLPVCLTNLI